MRRRHLLQAAAVSAAALAGPGAHAATLSPARDLRKELGAALARHQPLLVMASMDGCPFCRLVRDSYLAPLQRERGWAVVQLDMDSKAAAAGFDGRPATQGELLRALHVDSYPTVLFFGRDGAEAAPRLVGASIPDFYGAYLEERVNQARRGT